MQLCLPTLQNDAADVHCGFDSLPIDRACAVLATLDEGEEVIFADDDTE